MYERSYWYEYVSLDLRVMCLWDGRRCSEILKATTRGIERRVRTVSQEFAAIREWRNDLAKKSQPDKPRYKAPASVQWVNISISDADEEALDAWDGRIDDTFSALAGLVASGYNLSFKYESGTNTYLAYLICADTGSPNWGKGLSARSSDFGDCGSVLVYKHFTLLEGIWGKPETDGSRGRKRG